ncbi:TPA: hypothetical protein ACH3X2_013230 [Trebouxia sp. C0005]
MVLLNALVNDTRQLRGHAILPVTVRLLRQRSEAYLPFLNRVLTDLIPAAANNQQGTKLFTLLPQCSNQMAFVEITTSGLHRLLHLMPDSPPFIPDLNSRTTPLFEVRKVLWWMMFTRYPQFCNTLSMQRTGWHFYWEVLIDGVSVSIVLAQFPTSTILHHLSRDCLSACTTTSTTSP